MPIFELNIDEDRRWSGAMPRNGRRSGPHILPATSTFPRSIDRGPIEATVAGGRCFFLEWRLNNCNNVNKVSCALSEDEDTGSPRGFVSPHGIDASMSVSVVTGLPLQSTSSYPFLFEQPLREQPPALSRPEETASYGSPKGPPRSAGRPKQSRPSELRAR
jgi:hypothetical protein